MGMTAHKLNRNWNLWINGDLSIMYVQNREGGEEIPIDISLMKMLVARLVKDEKVEKLENMNDDEILGLEAPNGKR